MPTQLRDVLEDGSPHVVDDAGQLVGREEVARRYYATRVVVLNDSDIAFEGTGATVDGIETPIPPHEQEVVDIGWVHRVLGDPYFTNGDPVMWRKEYNRLNHRFEGRRTNMVIPKEQIDNQARLIQLGYMSPEDAIVENREIPKLVVLDRETGMTIEPPQGWPLYNDTPLADVGPVVEATVPRSEFEELKARMEQMLKTFTED